MKAVPLAVAGAFHTPIMDSAVDRLREALDRVPDPPALDPGDLERRRRAARRSRRNPPDCCCGRSSRRCAGKTRCASLLDDGYDQFYEVGPGRVLRGLLKRIDRKIACAGTLD